MARRDRREDETPAWLKFLGGAIAAGAAAYGAKKLYDAVSETPKTETCYEKPTPAKVYDDDDDSDDDYKPPTGPGKSAGLGDPYSACSFQETPGSNLHEQLDTYYRTYVDIEPGAMDAAQQVVDEVVEMLQYQFEKTWPNWGIGILKQVGSTVEGLKVIKPDEFDFMVPITLDESNWELIDAADTEHCAPGFWLLKKVNDASTPFEKYVQESYLSPAKMRSVFQGALQKMVNQNTTGYPIKSSTHGPSITYDVEYIAGMKKKSLSIDFVPTVSLYNGWKQGVVEIVGKPHPSSRAWSQTGNPLYDILWRRSFSTKESEKLQTLSETTSCHAKCLKILKAVRMNHSQLGMLSSYVLKTVLLHQMNDSADAEWSHRELSERFVDLVRALLLYIEERCLPHYFTSDVNLFAQYEETSLYNLETYLKRVARKNDFGSLLKR